MLKAGELAPDFGQPDQDNRMVNLSGFQGEQNVVLYFYPKDDTPGCTTEAMDFTAMEKDFADLDTVILGVSKDDCASHAAFIKKHGLTVRLLADTNGEVCEKYGVWQEKERNGEKKMGIVRSTFIIGKDGYIKHAMYGVKSDGHAAEVLQLTQAL